MTGGSRQALGDPARRTERRWRNQRLNLDQQRRGAFERYRDDGAGGPGRRSSSNHAEKLTTGSSPRRSSKRARARRRAEAVLGRPQHPQVVARLALQREDGVDQVLEQFGPAMSPSLVTWPTRTTGTPASWRCAGTERPPPAPGSVNRPWPRPGPRPGSARSR